MTTSPTLNVVLAEGTPLPSYARAGDAGFDLSLNMPEPITLAPNTTTKISLGISMEIPAGHFGLVVPRSSLAKRNLMLCNTVGIIDSGYRGDIIAFLRNLGTENETLTPGDRLLQIVIIPVTQVTIQPVAHLSETDRGTGGFGSTNSKAS